MPPLSPTATVVPIMCDFEDQPMADAANTAAGTDVQSTPQVPGGSTGGTRSWRVEKKTKPTTRLSHHFNQTSFPALVEAPIKGTDVPKIGACFKFSVSFTPTSVSAPQPMARPAMAPLFSNPIPDSLKMETHLTSALSEAPPASTSLFKASEDGLPKAPATPTKLPVNPLDQFSGAPVAEDSAPQAPANESSVGDPDNPLAVYELNVTVCELRCENLELKARIERGDKAWEMAQKEIEDLRAQVNALEEERERKKVRVGVSLQYPTAPPVDEPTGAALVKVTEPELTPPPTPTPVDEKVAEADQPVAREAPNSTEHAAVSCQIQQPVPVETPREKAMVVQSDPLTDEKVAEAEQPVAREASNSTESATVTCQIQEPVTVDTPQEKATAVRSDPFNYLYTTHHFADRNRTTTYNSMFKVPGYDFYAIGYALRKELAKHEMSDDLRSELAPKLARVVEYVTWQLFGKRGLTLNVLRAGEKKLLDECLDLFQGPEWKNPEFYDGPYGFLEKLEVMIHASKSYEALLQAFRWDGKLSNMLASEAPKELKHAKKILDTCTQALSGQGLNEDFEISGPTQYNERSAFQKEIPVIKRLYNGRLEEIYEKFGLDCPWKAKQVKETPLQIEVPAPKSVALATERNVRKELITKMKKDREAEELAFKAARAIKWEALVSSPPSTPPPASLTVAVISPIAEAPREMPGTFPGNPEVKDQTKTEDGSIELPRPTMPVAVVAPIAETPRKMLGAFLEDPEVTDQTEQEDEDATDQTKTEYEKVIEQTDTEDDDLIEPIETEEDEVIEQAPTEDDSTQLSRTEEMPSIHPLAIFVCVAFFAVLQWIGPSF
ncbi:hypothetical protein CC80DRAFT_547640 [Byssothecium circinans]|uniref:Uncharacterized protein n=1 Tax=Byssothecium circinans TaxID=147558 RepID=A0A6A5U727_9PLEO|nr:hypothetical protein CC80DRAFT_547640 [Byssothecium circinans]